MTKLEKVIYSFECCSSRVRSCSGCAYDYKTAPDCWQSLERDALELLKEQEPVEPKREVNENGQILSCGNCSAWFAVQKQKYCHECGKAVKWE